MDELVGDKTSIIGKIEDRLDLLDTDSLTGILVEIQTMLGEFIEMPSETGSSLHAAVEFIEDNLLTADEEILPEEYSYSCLPLCLLDAVYSIGVRYESTRNVVRRYCENQRIERLGTGCDDEPQTIEDLINSITNVGGPASFAENVVRNRQKTSSQGGILKAKAVLQCAKVLSEQKVKTIKDFRKAMADKTRANDLEVAFRNVTGQASGISFRYLCMLCGDQNTAKPDRHILRFLGKFMGSEPSPDEARIIMNELTAVLNERHEGLRLTVREVDYLIWNYMSRKN